METSSVGVDLSLASVRLALASRWLRQVDASAGKAGVRCAFQNRRGFTVYYLYPRQHHSILTDMDNAISAAVAGVVRSS